MAKVPQRRRQINRERSSGGTVASTSITTGSATALAEASQSWSFNSVTPIRAGSNVLLLRNRRSSQSHRVCEEKFLYGLRWIEAMPLETFLYNSVTL